MKIAKLVLAGTAAFTLSTSAALAQQEQTGQVTMVNRLTNTVSIRPVQNGTVGANTDGAAQEFKVKDGVSLENLHAGNQITYSTSEAGGIKTITKFKDQ